MASHPHTSLMDTAFDGDDYDFLITKSCKLQNLRFEKLP